MSGNNPAGNTGNPASGNSLGGRAVVSGHMVQAGTVRGGVHLHPAVPATLPPPRQLPAGPRIVVDRAEALARLSDLVEAATDGPARLAAVTGMAGIGKTTLVLTVAHAYADRFPGGSMFADLGEVGTATDVRRRWLRGCGVPPELIPAGEEEAAGLWRSVSAARPVLAIAVNVSSAAQARMLRPACGVLVVTSHRNLDELSIDDAELLRLPPLDTAACVELVTRIAPRTATDSDLARLAELCGGHPLAARIAAARLATHPQVQVTDLVRELSTHRLPSLTIGATSVSINLDAAYRDLSPAGRYAFRIIAQHPGPQWSAPASAAMLDTPQPTAQALIDELARLDLLEEAGHGRWRMHDLVVDYARGIANPPAEEIAAAAARACDYYARTAAAAEHVRHPGRRRIGWRAHLAATGTPMFTTPQAALAWLNSEADNIVAAQQVAIARRWYDLAYELGETLHGYHQAHRDHDLWERTSSLAVEAAHAMRHPVAEARMLISLALCAGDRHEWNQVNAIAAQALRLSRAAGDRLGEASAREHLATAQRGVEAFDQAIAEYEHALAITEQVGTYPRAAALIWRELGRTHTAAGHLDQARTALAHAHRLFDAARDEYMRGRCHLDRADLYLRAREPRDALDEIDLAIPLITGTAAYPFTLGHAHMARAQAYLALGDLDAAHRCATEAEKTYQGAGAPDAHPALVRVRDLTAQITAARQHT